MSLFRMDPRRPAREELQRATAEQVELAQAVLAAARAWPAERRAAAVHGFRKSAKRIRAAVDLARDGGDRAAATLLKQGFREASRALSHTRDRDALGAILKRVSRCVPRRRRATVLAAWKALLLPSIPSMAGVRTDRMVEEIEARLRAMGRSWRSAHLSRFTPMMLAAALERNWDRARGRFEDDWDPKDPEWLHETRKRCQRLHYQVMLIESWKPKRLGDVRRALAQACEHLGMARDTGLLMARSRGVIAPADAELKTLRTALSEEQRRSLREARRIGRRILRPPGRALRKQIEDTCSEYASRFADQNAKRSSTK